MTFQTMVADLPSNPTDQRILSVPKRLSTGMAQIIRGREDTINLVITALLADGHVLIEDLPGSGKTTLAKTLGLLIDYEFEGNNKKQLSTFRRIQFTPDMLPSDVLGVTVFETSTNSFRFIEGPIFAHLVLADELNRTSPKVQAAFLECMAEKQVTVDNVTHSLDELFFVIGTQNPLDMAGTYPLPGVQLDRFLFRIPMAYVNSTIELELLRANQLPSEKIMSISPVVSRSEILAARAEIAKVFIAPTIQEAMVFLAEQTRTHQDLTAGLSTRALLLFQRALQSWAFCHGRFFVEEDDVKQIAPYILSHRLSARGGKGALKEIIDNLIQKTIERIIKPLING
jgi:MoxR-like ATPase